MASSNGARSLEIVVKQKLSCHWQGGMLNGACCQLEHLCPHQWCQIWVLTSAPSLRGSSGQTEQWEGAQSGRRVEGLRAINSVLNFLLRTRPFSLLLPGLPRHITRYYFILLKLWLNWQTNTKNWFQIWLLITSSYYFLIFLQLKMLSDFSSKKLSVAF